MTPLVVLHQGSLMTPLEVSQCRVVGDSWLLVALYLSVGDSASGWLGSELVLIIDGDSSNAQSELGVVGDSSTASLELVINSSSLSFRGMWIETLLRVLICGLP